MLAKTGRLLGLLIFFFGMGMAVYTVVIGYGVRIHIPIADQLYQLQIVERVFDGGFLAIPFSEWLELHSGAHRIVFIRLGMALDYRFFGGQNHLLHLVTLACLAASVFVIAKFAASIKWDQDSQLALILGIVFFWSLSPTQLTNWINPINNSWIVSHSLNTLAAFLICYPRTVKPWQAICALLLCLLSSLSTFSGVPALALVQLALLMRAPRLGLLLLPISIGTLYCLMDGMTSGYSMFKETAPDVLATVPMTEIMVGSVRNLAVYLSSPISIQGVSIGIILALSSMMYLAYAIVAMFRLSWAKENLRYRFRYFCLIGALAALAVALGSVMGRAVFSQPTAARYQTFVCMYWLFFSLLLVTEPFKSSNLRFASYSFVLAMMISFTLLSFDLAVRGIARAELAARFAHHANAGTLDELDYRTLLARAKVDHYREFDAFFKKNKLAHYH